MCGNCKDGVEQITSESLEKLLKRLIQHKIHCVRHCEQYITRLHTLIGLQIKDEVSNEITYKGKLYSWDALAMSHENWVDYSENGVLGILGKEQLTFHIYPPDEDQSDRWLLDKDINYREIDSWDFEHPNGIWYRYKHGSVQEVNHTHMSTNQGKSWKKNKKHK